MNLLEAKTRELGGANGNISELQIKYAAKEEELSKEKKINQILQPALEGLVKQGLNGQAAIDFSNAANSRTSMVSKSTIQQIYGKYWDFFGNADAELRRAESTRLGEAPPPPVRSPSEQVSEAIRSQNSQGHTNLPSNRNSTSFGNTPPQARPLPFPPGLPVDSLSNSNLPHSYSSQNLGQSGVGGQPSPYSSSGVGGQPSHYPSPGIGGQPSPYPSQTVEGQPGPYPYYFGHPGVGEQAGFVDSSQSSYRESPQPPFKPVSTAPNSSQFSAPDQDSPPAESRVQT